MSGGRPSWDPRAPCTRGASSSWTLPSRRTTPSNPPRLAARRLLLIKYLHACESDQVLTFYAGYGKPGSFNCVI